MVICKREKKPSHQYTQCFRNKKSFFFDLSISHFGTMFKAKWSFLAFLVSIVQIFDVPDSGLTLLCVSCRCCYEERSEMTDVEAGVTDFASSGRSGRRNALPDILGSPAGAEASDLPQKLADLCVSQGNFFFT